MLQGQPWAEQHNPTNGAFAGKEGDFKAQARMVPLHGKEGDFKAQARTYWAGKFRLSVPATRAEQGNAG